MKNDLEVRMELILNKDELTPELQALAKGHIDFLSSFGATSLDALLALVRDRSISNKARTIGCWLLGKLQDKSATQALLVAFQDHDTSLFWEAAKSLGLLGSKQAVQPLINALHETNSIDKRVAAIYALGLIGDKRSVEPLLQVLLLSGEDAEVRGEAAEALSLLNEALSLLNDEHVVTSLIKCLKDDSPKVRFWAAFALGELGDERALPELRNIAANDIEALPQWGTVKEEALSAIASIEAKL